MQLFLKCFIDVFNSRLAFLAENQCYFYSSFYWETQVKNTITSLQNKWVTIYDVTQRLQCDTITL